MSSLTARANTGTGTDELGGEVHADGFVAAVVLRDAAGSAVAPLTDTQLRASPVVINDPEIGQTTDAEATGDGSVIGLLKRLRTLFAKGAATVANSLSVSIASDQAAIPVNPAGVSATGSVGALNAAVSLAIGGAGGVVIDIRGTFVATITFQGTIDGTNWFTLASLTAGTQGPAASVTTATAPGAWWANAAGLAQVRAIATAYTSGSATVVLRAAISASVVSSFPTGNTTQAVSGTVTATVSAGTVNPVAPATPYFVNSAATTNGALILTGTSNVSSLFATNTGAAAAFVKLYNKATAPTVGADVPEMIIPVPAAVSGVPGVANIDAGFHGLRFALGLGIAITGGAADADTTAVAAGQVKVKLSRTV